MSAPEGECAPGNTYEYLNYRKRSDRQNIKELVSRAYTTVAQESTPSTSRSDRAMTSVIAAIMHGLGIAAPYPSPRVLRRLLIDQDASAPVVDDD